MSKYQVIAVVPNDSDDDTTNATPPNLSLWAKVITGLAGDMRPEFARILREGERPERDANEQPAESRSSTQFTIEFSPIDRIAVFATVLRGAAAIVDVGRITPADPDTAVRLSSAVLLGGDKDADDIVLDLAASMTVFEPFPAVIERARKDLRPVALVGFPSRRNFENEHLAHACTSAAAQAFFDAIGAALPADTPGIEKEDWQLKRTA
jgi:hypothetical protein